MFRFLERWYRDSRPLESPYPLYSVVYDTGNRAWSIISITSSAIVIQRVGTTEYHAVTASQLEARFSAHPNSEV